jgi:hypothetical protein
VPPVGDAFEVVLPVVLEYQSAAGDEVFDGARDENRTGLGEGPDSGADVHGKAAHVIAVDLAFACV